MALKKPTASSRSASSYQGSLDGGLLSSLPCLWSYLVDPAYEDGSRRQLATLMVFLHDGRLTAALNDRDNDRTVFASGTSLGALLEALEGHLKAGDAEWRPNQKGFQKKPKNGT